MDSQQVDLMLYTRKLAEDLALGYRQLSDHCKQAYKNSPEPTFHLRPKTPFLQQGPDPLDHILVYKNSGSSNDDDRIPRHWHYIGLGLSDINGYSEFRRRHEKLRLDFPAYANSTQPMQDLFLSDEEEKILRARPDYIRKSGFGFELTMRLKCDSDKDWNSTPPGWPERIMQDLARYVLQSKNIFKAGDHVAWRRPLDSQDEIDNSSRIEQILLTSDPQLGSVQTRWGIVEFIQIVGVCSEELQAAREWNVRGVLDMMRERLETGGPYLVTDMRRGETIFELDPEKYDRLDTAIKQMGSDMAQISAPHKTSYILPDWYAIVDKRRETELNHPEYVTNLEGQVKGEDDYPARPPSRMSLGSESALDIENAELLETRYYDKMYILLSHESARVFPIMLNGRLAHGKHFSFQSFRGDSTITFQPEGSSEPANLVNREQLFARKAHWLQIHVPHGLRIQMCETIGQDFDQRLNKKRILTLPKNYAWPDYNLYLTVVDEVAEN